MSVFKTCILYGVFYTLKNNEMLILSYHADRFNIFKDGVIFALLIGNVFVLTIKLTI
jgi:hypothetical protein